MSNKFGIPDDLLSLTEHAEIKKANVLIIGETATGKSYFCSTGPRPIYHYALDRAGNQGLRNFTKEGWIISDNRFADDNPLNPTQWERFYTDLKSKIDRKVFHSFGTVALDGLTSMSTLAMNQVLKERGRAGGTPSGSGYGDSDYSVVQAKIKNLLYLVLTLPCTVIVTAHVDNFKDEATNKPVTGVALTGKLRQEVPRMFGEIYYADPKWLSTGRKWEVVTSFDGTYNARSGLLTNSMREPSNLLTIMRKAGLNIPDIVTADFYKHVPSELKELTK